jgi:hypothetical protein
MFTFPAFRRRDDRLAGRRPSARRPLVEDLEGRRLLSGIQGNHIGSFAAASVGQNLVGSVSAAAGTSGLSAGDYTVRFFE